MLSPIFLILSERNKMLELRSEFYAAEAASDFGMPIFVSSGENEAPQPTVIACCAICS